MNNFLPPDSDWSFTMDAQAYPILLPHVVCLDEDLYVNGRLTEKLTRQQADFLGYCDGRQTFATIISGHSVDLSSVIHLTQYLLWWHSPVNKWVHEFEECDRLVFSESLNSVWEAMGGRMLFEYPPKGTIIINCFSSSQSELAARDEAFFASRLTSVGHRVWNIAREKINSATDIFTDMIRASIERAKPSEIFIPASLGRRPLSHLIHNTVIGLVAEGYIDASVHLYSDGSPLGYRHTDEFYSTFEGTYFNPREYWINTSATAASKNAMLDLFAASLSSEQKLLTRTNDGRVARNFGDSGWTAAEHFWQLDFSTMI